MILSKENIYYFKENLVVNTKGLKVKNVLWNPNIYYFKQT